MKLLPRLCSSGGKSRERRKKTNKTMIIVNDNII
jgi:hypothetical protein